MIYPIKIVLDNQPVEPSIVASVQIAGKRWSLKFRPDYLGALIVLL